MESMVGTCRREEKGGRRREEGGGRKTTAFVPAQFTFDFCKAYRLQKKVGDGRMAVLLVDTLLIRNLNRNPNRNPNPLTAGRRSHIRPVPH
ncbi:MAG: hypothetical protein WCU90_09950, partial [Kiritimatiellia bacterium]